MDKDSTPLHRAALDGDLKEADRLLDAGADINAVDNEFGSTPISWANEKGRENVVIYLLSRGASVRPFETVAFGLLRSLKELVARDRAVLTFESDWGTLLHLACIWGRPELVDWLLEQGLDRNRRSRQGFTPLDIAEAQARDGRTHTPIVIDERKAEIERDCARIAARLRMSK